jgi:hypothetical protein
MTTDFVDHRQQEARHEESAMLRSWRPSSSQVRKFRRSEDRIGDMHKGPCREYPDVDTHGLTPVALAKEVCIYLEGCMPSNSL